MLQLSNTLAPSDKAMGLNQYLGKMEFSIMLMAAVGLHLLGLAVFSLIPPKQVQNVPVRVMNLRLSPEEGLTAAPRFSADILQQLEQPEAVMEEPLPEVDSVPEPAPKVEPKPVESKPKKKSSPKPAPKTADSVQQQGVTITKKKTPASPKEVAPVKARSVSEKRIKVSEAVKPKKPSPLSPNAVPRQNVRETFARPTGGGSSEEAREEILRRYEQVVSQWLMRHRVYPEKARAEGISGEGMVRLRINRLGNVVYAAVEKSTGVRILDEALIAMVKRANPVPAVPSDYPAGKLVEFLVPIRFN